MKSVSKQERIDVLNRLKQFLNKYCMKTFACGKWSFYCKFNKKTGYILIALHIYGYIFKIRLSQDDYLYSLVPLETMVEMLIDKRLYKHEEGKMSEKTLLVIVPGKWQKTDSAFYLLVEKTGECLASHFCSNYGWAYQDLYANRPERIEEWTKRFGDFEVKYIDEVDGLTENEMQRRNKEWWEKQKEEIINKINEIEEGE